MNSKMFNKKAIRYLERVSKLEPASGNNITFYESRVLVAEVIDGFYFGPGHYDNIWIHCGCTQ